MTRLFHFPSILNRKPIVVESIICDEPQNKIRCGHCKRLKPEFAKAADILKNEDPPIALLQVDCDGEGKETCQRYQVQGYPTLKAFKKSGDLDKPEAYNGPRDARKFSLHPSIHLIASTFIQFRGKKPEIV